MDNLAQFLSDLKAQEEKIYSAIGQVEKDVVREIYEALQESKADGGTPVLTGWLRSNWILSIDSEVSGPVGSRDNISPALAAQQSAFDNVMNANLLDADMIWFNNDVEYGPAVNYGNKNYAGHKFRERSIKRGLDRLNTQRVVK